MKKLISSGMIKILVCFIILMISFIFCQFYQSFAYEQTAWPESKSNKLKVGITGPWGEGGLVITATTTWGNKDKTKPNFIERSRNISLSATGYGDGRYGAKLNQSSVPTTSETGTNSNYAVITFTVNYTIPAHYKKTDYRVFGSAPGGRFNCNTGIGHDGSNHVVTVTYEVNVSRFGMVVCTEDQKQHRDSSSLIYLGRDSVNVQYNNGYGGGWVSIGNKYCGDKLGGLPWSLSRQYYDFDGWYNEHGNEVNPNSVVCTDDDWFCWITARWVHQTTEVTFYPRGGGGNMGVQTVNLGENTTLKKNVFTRETYTFLGWTDEDDGRTVKYKDGATINLKNFDGLELYAVWQKSDTGFDTQQIIEDAEMFGADGELRGGAGTTFDRNRTDSRFAHIDGGESDPAYFTKR